MSENQTLLINLDSPQAKLIAQALASEQRVKVLLLLAEKAMNVKEIAAAMQVKRPTVSGYIKELEAAGLIASARFSTGKASERRCWATFEKLIIETPTQQHNLDQEHTQDISMPVGLFTNVNAPCGFASETRILGIATFISESVFPERVDAQLIWFPGEGWLEYLFPSVLKPTYIPTAIEISAEMCSETGDYNNDYPSDITIWVNGTEVGTWECPGDFGGRRGRLNPRWWPDEGSQYGRLIRCRVDTEGCYIQGVKTADITLSDLNIRHDTPITLRIGVKPDAVHIGGLNIFGSRFGDHPQDLILRYYYLIDHSS